MRVVNIKSESGSSLRGMLDKIGQCLTVALSRKFGAANVRRATAPGRLELTTIRLAASGQKHMDKFIISETDWIDNTADSEDCLFDDEDDADDQAVAGSKSLFED